tara:strand:+ start:184 stop:1314 length:1131 start_codon:yes stop_codon:yes gene_type:complete
MKVVLFFTYGVSLKDWATTGLLQREITPYTILMRRENVSFIFLTYGDEEDRRYARALSGIEIIPVFERLPRPKSKFLQFVLSMTIPWIYRASLRDATIYKTNQIWGGWLAALSSLLWKKPLLVRCGYEPNKNNMHAGISGVRQRLTYVLSSFAYRHAAHTIGTTSEIIQYITDRFYVDKETTSVIPNWVDSSTFIPPDHSTRKITDKVLFVGRLSKEKNLSLLIQALSNKKIGLTIVGSGPERNRIEMMAVEHAVPIEFLPQISNTLMPQYYQKYAVYILCSEFEGSPKTLLEAMSCGCAVIGTDSPGITSVIEHDRTGLIVPNSPSDLFNAIEYLLCKPTERQRLGLAAREFIVERHSLDDAVKAEWSVYQKLVP